MPRRYLYSQALGDPVVQAPPAFRAARQSTVPLAAGALLETPPARTRTGPRGCRPREGNPRDGYRVAASNSATYSLTPSKPRRRARELPWRSKNATALAVSKWFFGPGPLRSTNVAFEP